jgi:biopolymer transport protein ExbB
MQRGQVLRSIGNEKRMRHHNLAMMVVALAIVTTQNPAVHAPGNMAPNGSALSAPAAQAEQSPENPATPRSESSRTKGTSATPPTGEPSISVAELPQDLSPWGMFLHADTIVKGVMIGLAIA